MMQIKFCRASGPNFHGKNRQVITFFVIKTAQRCGHVAYKMLICRALMIFLQSRLHFVENAARYMNPRQGAYGLSL